MNDARFNLWTKRSELTTFLRHLNIKQVHQSRTKNLKSQLILLTSQRARCPPLCLSLRLFIVPSSKSHPTLLLSWSHNVALNALFRPVEYAHSLNAISSVSLIVLSNRLSLRRWCSIYFRPISARRHGLVNEHMAQQLAAFSTEYDFISPETDIA